MTTFEFCYLAAEPVLPPLYGRIRQALRKELRMALDIGSRPRVLDVGGRKSHYTTGIPADVFVSDLPRKTELQKMLNLGTNASITSQLLRRRSNVRNVVFDDMASSSLRSGSFDCVVAVEVLEHVPCDSEFVHEVHRVLKPGGVFLMTTPNGDYRHNTNPDHQRHYKRSELDALLGSVFPEAQVEYAIAGGRARRYGLRSWGIRKPLQTALSIISNAVNSLQSRRPELRNQPLGTHHLVARCQKAN
jgi:SAM-dependent methyltransferase